MRLLDKHNTRQAAYLLVKQEAVEKLCYHKRTLDCLHLDLATRLVEPFEYKEVFCDWCEATIVIAHSFMGKLTHIYHNYSTEHILELTTQIHEEYVHNEVSSTIRFS